MTYRHLAFATFLIASGVAQAQATRWIEVEDGAMIVPAFNLTVDELDGISLYDRTGERVGELDDVLIGEDGKSMAASLDIGGFLGLGERDVVVPFDSLTLGEEGLITTMDKEGLESLPEYVD